MFKRTTTKCILGTIGVILLLAGTTRGLGNGEATLTIKIKAKVIVLGPFVKLGDIGKIVVPDRSIAQKLKKIRITQAPPPGESTEISLSYIKRRLRAAGFEKYLSVIQGPRNIRVVTAQTDIDRAFLVETLAQVVRPGVALL